MPGFIFFTIAFGSRQTSGHDIALIIQFLCLISLAVLVCKIIKQFVELLFSFFNLIQRLISRCFLGGTIGTLNIQTLHNLIQHLILRLVSPKLPLLIIQNLLIQIQLVNFPIFQILLPRLLPQFWHQFPRASIQTLLILYHRLRSPPLASLLLLTIPLLHPHHHGLHFQPIPLLLQLLHFLPLVLTEAIQGSRNLAGVGFCGDEFVDLCLSRAYFFQILKNTRLLVCFGILRSGDEGMEA